MKSDLKTDQLPLVTIISRSNENGLINKNSIILLDGKMIKGLLNFSIEMDGNDPTGLPTINISLKGYTQVVQEQANCDEDEDESVR